jgi:PAT family acetyl-CoA transporter-like MFS transporter 1
MIIPIIILLVEKKVPYKELAFIASAGLPFVLKFLFAPFLDAYYFKTFGKRKSYIVPIAYGITLILLYLNNNLQNWIDE